MPKISQKGERLPLSPIRKLTPYADDAKRRGVKVYHLNIGQPDLPTPQKALDALHNLDIRTISYTHSQGILPLRQGIVRYYSRFGIHLSEDDVIVTTGGSEALLFTLMALMDPGDEVIMMEPTYANYFTFAHIAGVNARTVTSYIEDGFALPPVEEIEMLINTRTKAIMICNPNNPTGYVYSREELMAIRKIALKHDLFVIGDEVYREFLYTDDPVVSLLHLPDLEEHAIVIDSMSKRYSECGIRVGMVVSRNQEVMKTLLKFAQSRLCPPHLGQVVAEASIDGTEQYSRECYDEYIARRNFFIEGLNRIPGVFSPMPKGAFYTVASLPVEDTEDFCRWMLSDFVYNDGTVPGGETVMMAPASGFYNMPAFGKNQVRLAYVLCKEDLARALTVLEAGLAEYQRHH